MGNDDSSRASISPRSLTSGCRPAKSARRVPAVEAVEHPDPVDLAGRDGVEDLLEPSGEVVVDEVGEVLLHEPHDGEREERRHQRGPALHDVAAVDDRAHDRGVRRRAADAALLERLHERGLGVARRRVRRVALGVEAQGGERVADGERRETALGVVAVPVRVVVDRLLVRREEAAEGDHGAGHRELRVATVGRDGAETDRRGLAPGVGHLRGDGALPDEVVEREVVAAQLAGDLRRRTEHVARRADRLVRLLGVLHLAVVAARHLGHVVAAVELSGLRARGVDRRLGQRRGVGTHVGDVAALVEALRDAHRALRAPAQLAARLLLERGGHERRGR